MARRRRILATAEQRRYLADGLRTARKIYTGADRRTFTSVYLASKRSRALAPKGGQ